MKMMHFPPEPGTSSQRESPAQRRARFEEEALPHRRALYAAAPSAVDAIMAEGPARTREIAADTMRSVKRAMKLL